MNNILQRQTEILCVMYRDFNVALFENSLDDVAITIQSKGRRNCYGWFTLDKVWSGESSNENRDEGTYNEINISAEHMNRGIYEVAGTLIHEMVHYCNFKNGIKDSNPKTGNHNKDFKELAEKVGLVVEKSEKHGYSTTYLSDELKKKIDEFNYIDCFNVARISATKEKEKKEKKPQKKYRCGCGVEIKTTKELEIICARCNEKFEDLA